MSAKKLLELWTKFLFEPQSPVPIALFRIMLGLLLLQMQLVHVGNDLFAWYGPHGPIQFESIKKYYWLNSPHFDLFLLFPNTDHGVLAFWCIFVAATVCLTLGLFTRIASIAVCLGMITIQNHQPFNLNGGDSMLRLYTGYLMFSDCGAAISLDRLIKRFRQPTFAGNSLPKPIVPWGQRLIQIQLAVAYWSTFEHKISGRQWLDGTAVYYATHLEDMVRFQLPLLYDNLLFCKLLTWYTLVVEGAMFSLVWFKEFRYYVLLAAFAMHFGIDVSINLPVFEWAFIAGFVTFIAPEDLSKCMDYIKARIAAGFGAPQALHYNPEVARQKSLASMIEGLDVFGRLTISPLETARLCAKDPVGELHGFRLFCWLTGPLPLLWPLFPVLAWMGGSSGRTDVNGAASADG